MHRPGLLCSLLENRFVTHPRAMKSKGKFDFDVAVIGGGSAGYAAARTAAGAGLKTVVIEGGKEVGGLCILRGCMPSKALLYAAEILHLSRHAERWGIKPGKVRFDFQKVMTRKARLIREFADYRKQQLEGGTFEFLRANVRFANPHTLELSSKPLTPSLSPADGERVAVRQGEGQIRKITARSFIIATGSVISPPPLPQLAKAGYITSDHALSL